MTRLAITLAGLVASAAVSVVARAALTAAGIIH